MKNFSKLFFVILIGLSTISLCMNHDNHNHNNHAQTDTELSDSDSETQAGYFRANETGTYYFVLTITAQNMGDKQASISVSFNINGGQKYKKTISIEADTTKQLYDTPLLSLKLGDVLDFIFKSDDGIEIVNQKIDYTIIPEGSSIKG